MYRTLVQALHNICRYSGDRFAPYLPKVMPLLLECCASTDDDDLRESCIQVTSFNYLLYIM